jgi:hypothetical protein
MTSSDTVRQAQIQLQKAAKAVAEMADELALAEQILEFNHDRCKQALARRVVEYLDRGDSAAAAEFRARADDLYRVEIEALGLQYKDAMTVRKTGDAHKVLWESARSILSMEKAKVSML